MGLASIALSEHVGAFDTLWSWALVLGGAVSIALSEISERRETTAAVAPAGAMA